MKRSLLGVKLSLLTALLFIIVISVFSLLYFQSKHRKFETSTFEFIDALNSGSWENAEQVLSKYPNLYNQNNNLSSCEDLNLESMDSEALSLALEEYKKIESEFIQEIRVLKGKLYFAQIHLTNTRTIIKKIEKHLESERNP